MIQAHRDKIMDDAVNTPRFQIKSESVGGSGGLSGPLTTGTTASAASGGTGGTIVNVGVVNGAAEGSVKDKSHGERKRQVRCLVLISFFMKWLLIVV